VSWDSLTGWWSRRDRSDNLRPQLRVALADRAGFRELSSPEVYYRTVPRSTEPTRKRMLLHALESRASSMRQLGPVSLACSRHEHARRTRKTLGCTSMQTQVNCELPPTRKREGLACGGQD
jgi:hypothetical protein